MQTGVCVSIRARLSGHTRARRHQVKGAETAWNINLPSAHIVTCPSSVNLRCCSERCIENGNVGKECCRSRPSESRGMQEPRLPRHAFAAGTMPGTDTAEVRACARYPRERGAIRKKNMRGVNRCSPHVRFAPRAPLTRCSNRWSSPRRLSRCFVARIQLSRIMAHPRSSLCCASSSLHVFRRRVPCPAFSGDVALKVTLARLTGIGECRWSFNALEVLVS